MASVVIIIRVPFEARDVDHRLEKEEPNNSDIKAAPIGKQANENDTALLDKSLKEGEPQGTKIDKPTEPDGPDSPESANVEFKSPQSIVEILQNVLKNLKVQGTTWQITKDKQFHQVMFIEDVGERVEKVLSMLIEVGIGLRPKTSVSVIPTSVHIQKRRPTDSIICNNENDEIAEEETQSLLSVTQNQEKELSTKDTFIKSIKSRLTVEQVVEGVKLQARLTFDFVTFTILASLIAAVGLVEDNSVVLVASMLVSPLMGPILGGTFGYVIKNKGLQNMGLRTEIIGLMISVFVGFLFGFVCGPFGLDGASWSHNNIHSWPTKEMSSRGMLRSMWVGILIALPSGAGVALSVLGGNAGSLVGVAISASLLPPAVNSGMLWAYAIISTIKHPMQLAINESQITNMEIGCPKLKDNNYIHMYSCHMGEEAAIMAIISLILTIVNIICILITGTLVLKFKEVTSRASSSNAAQTFWTKDVKVAREAYQTFKGSEATSFKNTFLQEWKKLSGDDQEPQNETEFLDMIKEVEEDEEFQIILGKTPQGRQYMHQYSKDLKQQMSVEDKLDDNTLQATMHQLWTIHNQYSQHPKTASHPRHVETVFQRTPEQTHKTGRNFVVTDIDKPHHTSVVTVRPPTEASEKYSVLTESGV